MHLIWHILITALCAYECAVCLPVLRARFIRLLMFAGLGLIHGVMPILTPRYFYFSGATDGDIHLAAFAAFIGIAMFSIGFRFYERFRSCPNGLDQSLFDWLDDPRIHAALRRLFWASMAIGMFAMMGDWVLRAGSIGAMFSAGRFDFRFEGGYVSIVLRHVVTLLYIPGFIGFFLTRKHRMIGVAFALIVAFVMIFVTKGSRGMPIGLIGGPMLAYVLCYSFSPKRMVNLAVAGFVMSVLIIGVYEARKTMKQDTIGETLIRLVTPETYEKALTRDPLNTHQFLVAAVQHFPSEHDYLHGATYIRILMFAVPGRWLPEIKPEDTHLVFGRVITGRSTSMTTMMPTMPGDGYINLWGLPGVIIVMFVNGVAVAFVARCALVSPIWTVAIGARFVGLAVVTLRGQPYEVVFSIITSIVIVWFIGRLCGVNWRLVENISDESLRHDASIWDEASVFEKQRAY